MAFVFGIIIIVLAIILIFSCICIVPQASAWVVEFLGQYRASWEAGLHFKIPFFYRVVKKVSLKDHRGSKRDDASEIS